MIMTRLAKSKLMCLYVTYAFCVAFLSLNFSTDYLRSLPSGEVIVRGCPLVMESHGIQDDQFPGLESHGK